MKMVDYTDIVQCNDVRVRQSGGCAGFSQKSLTKSPVCAKKWR
jgi:hypothetical protein